MWLDELAHGAGRSVELADVPEEQLSRLQDLGVDLLWLIGVWPTGERSTQTARSHGGLQADYRRVLPDFTPADVTGSPYAVAKYVVDPALGGDAALAGLRRRLHKRGIGLVLDFVVNHTGLDHPWLTEHPDLYIQADLAELERAPDEFFRIETRVGPRIIAHGRDPYLPSWTDTAQLDLFNPATRHMLAAELHKVAAQCDGVRCDMAMLALPSIHRKTWGHRHQAPAGGQSSEPDFWPEATADVRVRHPNFMFIAEVYWNLENELRRAGFQYTYDKTLYDRLVHGTSETLRQHLSADPAWQSGCLRFLETHDEARAAAALAWDRHKAAAVLVATIPGLMLLHAGQLEGRRIKTPIQLRRRPDEPHELTINGFYERLLRTLADDEVVRRGKWSLLPVRAAWPDNPTWTNFIAYAWTSGHDVRLITANFGPTQGQCYVELASAGLDRDASAIEFKDALATGAERRYTYSPAQLFEQGLYLDMPTFGFHLFEVAPTRS